MKYLVCNFKNKLTKDDIIKYNNTLGTVNTNTKLVLIPPVCFLNFFDKSGYLLGAQDISSFMDKTITGEITPSHLKSLDCSYILVGHSERRIYKHEINIDFINKISNAKEANLNVIYCIGESASDHESGDTFTVLEKQISEVLNNVDLKNIIIAYEPVWSIGSGITPSKEDLLETIDFIKLTIEEKYNTSLDVLYGGSVNLSNIDELLQVRSIDGFLVGSASLDPNTVLEMLEKMQK